MTGLSNSDPIMRDIQNAAKVGHFDRYAADGPSQLLTTPVAVLFAQASTMTKERRRLWLAQIGHIWGERASLSGGKRSKATRLWLSKGNR